ncbi:odorant receptor 4-like [Halyomorpha halys]|nr:Odorant receptor 141 [Halyomorpha halys]
MAKLNGYTDPEDEKYFKIGFQKNYGNWLIYGGMFLGSPVLPITFLFCATTLIYFMFGTAIKFYKTDLVTTIENIHFLIFVAVEIGAMIVFLRKRGLIVSIFTTIGKGFFDYGNTLYDECLELKRDSYHKTDSMKRLIHHTFVTVVMSACIAITICRPVIIMMFPKENEGSPDDGMVKVALLPAWTPFDKSRWYTTVILWFIEYAVSWTTPGIVFGATFFVLFALEELGIQLLILKKGLNNVIQRAERLEQTMEENIRLCLKYSIRHHQVLFEFRDLLNEVVSLPGLGLFVSFSIMLCMSGFIFTLNEVPLVSKFVFGLFLLSECAMLFALCYFGEKIIELSEEIGDALYNSDWINYSQVMKNYMLIIQIRSRCTMRLSLMGFMDVSRNTFSNISSTSYSYLNLMNEFN